MNGQKGFQNQQNSQQQPDRLRRLLRWLTPNGGTLLLIALLLLTQNVWARSVNNLITAPGPAATTVNYQGRLADSSGNPLTGSYDMSFSLWDAVSGGNKVWGPESQTAVPVNDGLFHVGLGSQTSGGIPTSVWEGDRYLEITVNGETLNPRELVRSVPIAGMALTVPDGSITSEKQTATTFRATDNTYLVYQGTDEETVSEFSFDNVPAGDVMVIATLVVSCPEGASNTGRIRLLSVSPDRELERIATHGIQKGRFGPQLVLHNRLRDFPGGTLTLQIEVKGNDPNSELIFGVSNKDSRFGRHVTVLAG
jgi:hypothetical protein